MERLRLKVLGIALIAGIGAGLWADVGPPSMNQSRFPTERRDIRADLRGVESHTAAVDAWKNELKADKKAGNKMEAIADRKELAKAKADIVHDRQYLKADKRDLERDYKLIIKEHKVARRELRSDLCEAKADLRKDLRSNNGSTIEYNATEVAGLMRELDAEEFVLADLKSDRSLEKLAVKEEIKSTRTCSKAGECTASAE